MKSELSRNKSVTVLETLRDILHKIGTFGNTKSSSGNRILKKQNNFPGLHLLLHFAENHGRTSDCIRVPHQMLQRWCSLFPLGMSQDKCYKIYVPMEALYCTDLMCEHHKEDIKQFCVRVTSACLAAGEASIS